jgi:hypothetical protein
MAVARHGGIVTTAQINCRLFTRLRQQPKPTGENPMTSDKLAYVELYTSNLRATLAELTVLEGHVYTRLLLYGFENRGWIPNDMHRLLIVCAAADEDGNPIPRDTLEPVIRRMVAWKYQPHPEPQATTWRAMPIAGCTVVGAPEVTRLINPTQWDNWLASSARAEANRRRAAAGGAAARARREAHRQAEANPVTTPQAPAQAPAQAPSQAPLQAPLQAPGQALLKHLARTHSHRQVPVLAPGGNARKNGSQMDQTGNGELPSLPLSPSVGPNECLKHCLSTASSTAYGTPQAVLSSASASAIEDLNPPQSPPDASGGVCFGDAQRNQERPSRRRRYRKTAHELIAELPAEIFDPDPAVRQRAANELLRARREGAA